MHVAIDVCVCVYMYVCVSVCYLVILENASFHFFLNRLQERTRVLLITIVAIFDECCREIVKSY